MLKGLYHAIPKPYIVKNMHNIYYLGTQKKKFFVKY